MRVVFMGTPDFSTSILQELIDGTHDVIAVYTQPPRPSGRGHKVQKSPVHLLADQHEIPVFTPTTLKTVEQRKIFKSHKADVAIVVAYGLILPPQILIMPSKGCVNVHASLLPRWRGAAPIHRAIQYGDGITGVTLMQMDAGLDTGDMISQIGVPITQDTTTPQLHDILSQIGAAMVGELLDKGTWDSTPQPDDGVTYAEKLTKEESILNPAKTAHENLCQIRAFHPWPGSFMMFEGMKLKVLSAQSGDSSPLTFQCADEVIDILEIQKPGGKPMASADFLRGRRA